MENCVFCKIVRGEIKADFVYQDDEVAAFKDRNPNAPVHILVIPKKHIQSLNEVQDRDQVLLGKLLLTVKNLAQDLEVAQSGYKTVINTGIDGGQVIPHLHIHLIGGKKLDNFNFER